MELIAEILVAGLIVLGGLFALIGSWGLAKLPSLMTRLHGPTKATTLGVGSTLVASMFYFPVFQGTYSAHELLITLFLFVTAPVSANMIAKAHLHLSLGTGRDGAPEETVLPITGTDRGWATVDGPAPPAPESDLDAPAAISPLPRVSSEQEIPSRPGA